jgi:hypothetical protein
LAATQTPKHHHLAEDENGDDDDMTNGDNDNGSGGGDVSRDLDTDEHIKDPIEDRRTLAERNERLHDQLKVCPKGDERVSFNHYIVNFSF